jgi:hypothetical protein
LLRRSEDSPSVEVEKVVETAVVRLMLAIQMVIEVADITSSPGKYYVQNSCLEIFKVIEVGLVLQRIEERF